MALTYGEMSAIETQKRARRIAMSDDERDAFLATQKTCRVATLGADGSPHNSAVWFVWHDAALWIYSIVKSQRWTNLKRDARVAVVIDDGDTYFELRGVEFLGSVDFVGEEPRTGEPVAELEPVERIFAEKYMGTDALGYDQRHAWARLRPRKQVSWDFRKLGGTETIDNPNR